MVSGNISTTIIIKHLAMRDIKNFNIHFLHCIQHKSHEASESVHGIALNKEVIATLQSMTFDEIKCVSVSESTFLMANETTNEIIISIKDVTLNSDFFSKKLAASEYSIQALNYDFLATARHLAGRNIREVVLRMGLTKLSAEHLLTISQHGLKVIANSTTELMGTCVITEKLMRAKLNGGAFQHQFVSHASR